MMVQQQTYSDQTVDAVASGWTTYRLYGLALATDYPFVTPLVRASVAPDLAFTCVDRSPLAIDLDQATPVYSSPFRTDDGESTVYVYRLDTCDVLRFPGVADFYVWPDRITGHCLDSPHDYLMEAHLLSTVLAFWLQRGGILPLHASSVAVDGRAVAFLAQAQAGKSTLAAAFVQDGCPLLADDFLPVERCGDAFVGRPGHPQLRMWPDQALYFLGHYEDLQPLLPESSKRRVPVGFGGFGTCCDAPQPLARIYLPQRHDPAEGKAIEITPIPSRVGMFDLMRRCLRAYIFETKALGLQAQRLDLFADLALRVPMRRLVYPSGFDYLPAVRAAIVRDLSQ
jgi:hypothetical protein